MSLEQLEAGDPVKLKDDWSKRGKLVEIVPPGRNGYVIWEGSHTREAIPMKDLVHFTYTWDNDSTAGMR
jgi:hypothetical protein